ncbi:smg-7 (suppressor with morphological effect on genitalia protein 7), putative [Schistosoma mansoni]|uniref:smg-7 (suppressor with morphological effect on genitalia protein 7), putative n=1 Tax=Schistosoma mansoni TaxID=6183 RepID=UPI00022C84FB|nr:smg-7 (suppressor with morphological effect on genitalia protein 7), putative [Schistosoma mansoni]|eukprot:XP_018646165.1 smg-7 (suppressor with morphological effect on genitalia protein 7), putative [Schistosoma mansoni]
MTNEADPHRMWCDLKANLDKKPPNTCSAATQDEYFAGIQSSFVQLIIRFPLFTVEHKIELEMWNVLYKNQIDSLQSLLNQRLSGTGNSGSLKCSTMELKLRLVLLLDRASGIYFNLIYQLLQPISELPWPKVILGILASVDGILDSENNKKGKHVSDYLDLDLATFSANKASSKRMKHNEPNKFLSTTQESDTHVIAPRILSRGDRLPSEILTVSSSVENSRIRDQVVKYPDETEKEKENINVITDQSSNFHCLDQESAVIYLVHHCLVHLGDIARYRQQPNVAAGYYLWSWVVHPDSGHSFNQLAILEATKPLPRRCIDALFYYYIRALACLHSFPASMNNLSNVLLDYYKSFELSSMYFNVNNNHEKLPTDSTKDVMLSAKRWPKFTNQQIQTLIQFYAALYLHTDPVKLIKMADDLFENMNNWNRVELNKNQLIRILCIHFYLTDQYLSDTKSNLSSFQTIDGKSFMLNEHQTGTALLLCLTIYLINWITSSIVGITSKTLSSNEHISSTISNEETITNDSNNDDVDNCDNDNNSINKDENSTLLSSPTANIHPTSNDNNKIDIAACKLELLIALNLLFLWFRSNRFTENNAGNKSSCQLTDKLFQLVTPTFTENTVYFLNNLLKHYQPLLCNVNNHNGGQKQPTDMPVQMNNNNENTSDNVNGKTDDADIVEEEHENSLIEKHIDPCGGDDDNNREIEVHNIAPIDWTRLVKLPEIVVLQGFQPLLIPTQRSLCSSSTDYNPVHPFLDFSDDKLYELIIPNNENDVSRPKEIGLERVLCLLTSARYVALVFPSLINWIPNSGDKNSDSTETTSVWFGSFCCSSHSSSNLKDMFSALNKPTTITATAAINTNNKETQSNKTTLNNFEELRYTDTNPLHFHAVLNNNEQVSPKGSEIQKSINCDMLNPNLPESAPSCSNNNEQLSNIPVTTHHETIKANSINNETTKSSSPEVTTSNDFVVPSTTSSLPSSLLSHVGTSGGLIMNAELAKFIQEQASQVAARQQRFNMSTNSVINDDQQQLDSTGASIPTTICGNSDFGSLRGNLAMPEGGGVETSLSRLSLSATFKRNLPPRYAKLLQAKELQEKEALKNRYSHQTQNELSSSILPLDKPAPLARKESEAPTDLICLLSSSDVNPVVLQHLHEQHIQQRPQWF